MIVRTLALVFLATALAVASPGDHLKVGTEVPPIKEVDQSGVSHTLDELGGKNGTLLVIFRSADW